MSELIVEVCEVQKIEDHPNADRMKIATVKGWKTCCRHDPVTGWTEFHPGDKCIYFPPDSVLPPALSNGPEDNPPGRLNVNKYLKALPKGQEGGRVAATRLRGVPSYGLIIPIDPKIDQDWPIGTNVAEHFGVTKYEPPATCTDGDADKERSRFYKYSSPEHFQNFMDEFEEGEEIVVTEKIHGMNCRVGTVLDTDEEGNPTWIFVGGSHDVARKRQALQPRRFDLEDLIANGSLTSLDKVEDAVFQYGEKFWKIDEIDKRENKTIIRTHMCHKDGSPVWKESMFWEPINIKGMVDMIIYLRDEWEYKEDKHAVIVYGELYGTQDIKYGLQDGERAFRVFDIAINNQYLDFDDKFKLCEKFGVEMVPILYNGPYSAEIIEKLTDGASKLREEPLNVKAVKASEFLGREGVVIIPAKERLAKNFGKRLCLKSVSADYLGRKGGTEYH